MAETVKPYIDADSWDGKYTNGDDLNYALGMVRARVLAKPNSSEGTRYDLGGGLIWNETGINAKLKINTGKGLYVSPIQLSSNFNKLSINLYKTLVNDLIMDLVSGLEFTTGSIGEDEAPASNQLRIKLVELGAKTEGHFTSTSGLELIPAGEITPGSDLVTTGGLRIKLPSVSGLLINSNGLSIFTGEGLTINNSSNQLKLTAATSNNLGGIKIGYTSSNNRNFAVLLDNNNKAYVSVPSDNDYRRIYVNETSFLDSTSTYGLNFNDSDSITINSAIETGLGSITPEIKLKLNTSGLQIDSDGLSVVVGKGLEIGTSTGDIRLGQGSVTETLYSTYAEYSFSINSEEIFLLSISMATNSGAGLMSAYDKGCLDNILAGSDTISYNSDTYHLNVKLSGNSLTSDSDGIKVHLHTLAIVRSGSTDTYTNYTPLYISLGGLTLRLTDANGLTLTTNGTNGYLDIKPASTSQKGTVQLSNTYSGSTDQTTAPTSKALSDAYKAIMDTIGELEGVHFNIYSSYANLPDISTKAKYDANKNIIGLVPISGASAPDAYAEYVAIAKTISGTTTYVWEKIGDTNIDLSGYVQISDNLGSTEVSNIVVDVFGF